MLSSLNDVVHICIVIFVGYYARTANKPRIMAFTIIFSSIGGFLMAAPHFVLSDDTVAPVTSFSSYEKNASTLQFCHVAVNGSLPSDECKDSDGTQARVHTAYYFFVIAQLVSGVGSSGVFTLSLAYIDENVPKEKASIFLGTLNNF